MSQTGNGTGGGGGWRDVYLIPSLIRFLMSPFKHTKTSLSSPHTPSTNLFKDRRRLSEEGDCSLSNKRCVSNCKLVWKFLDDGKEGKIQYTLFLLEVRLAFV